MNPALPQSALLSFHANYHRARASKRAIASDHGRTRMHNARVGGVLRCRRPVGLRLCTCSVVRSCVTSGSSLIGGPYST